MNRIGRRALTAPRYVSLDSELAAIRRVTGAQVTTMARQLLGRPLTVEVAGPYPNLKALPASVRALGRRAPWAG